MAVRTLVIFKTFNCAIKMENSFQNTSESQPTVQKSNKLSEDVVYGDCEASRDKSTPAERGYLHKLFSHHPTDADRDCGTAWLVLFWSTVSHTLHIGFLLSLLGTIALQFQTVFGASIQQSSIACSANNFMMFGFAPIASVLVRKTSPRFLQMIGGVLMIIGIGGLAFSTDMWSVYLLYSVFSGVGASCCYIATTDVLVHHFERRKYLAFSVVILGYFSGVVIFPVVSQHLFDTVGFHTAMGILGCIHILHLIGGAFFTSRKRPDSERLHVASMCCKKSDHNSSSKEISTDVTHEVTSMGSEISTDVKNEEASVTSDQINHEELSEETVKTEEDVGLLQGIKKLLSSKKVWSLIANFGLWNFNVGGLLIFVNGFMVEYVNLTADEAAVGVTIIGACNVAGTVIAMVTSRFDFDRLILHAVLNSVYGAATILIAFSNGKIMYYIVGGIWGIAQGTHLANIVSVCYDFCGRNLLTILFSLTLFAEGLTGLTTGPLLGYLQSNVHPKSGLCLAGAAGIASCLVLIPVIVHKYYNKRKAERVTLKALVVGDVQKQIVNEVTHAANPEYTEIHVHLHHHSKDHHNNRPHEDEAKLGEINPVFENE